MNKFLGSYPFNITQHKWVSYEGLSSFRRFVIRLLGRGVGEWVLVGPKGTLMIFDEMVVL